MADEKPKAAPKAMLKTSKPLTKRPSKGYRKYLRRQKQAVRNPVPGTA